MYRQRSHTRVFRLLPSDPVLGKSSSNSAVISLDHFQECKKICCQHKLQLVCGYDGYMGILLLQIHRAAHKKDHKHHHLGMHREWMTSAYMKSNLADCQPIMTIALLVLNIGLNGQGLILHAPLYSRSRKLARLKKSQDECIWSSVWFAMVYFTKQGSWQTISPHRIPLW